MLSTKQLQLTEAVNSEHQEYPGLQVLSTKRLQLFEELNSEHQ